MDAIKKNWISWIMTFIIAVLSTIVTLAMSNKNDEDKAIVNDINTLKSTKVDLTEFKEYLKDNEKSHKEIVSKHDLQYEALNSKMDVILKATIENSTNVGWLVKDAEKKNKKGN